MYSIDNDLIKMVVETDDFKNAHGYTAVRIVVKNLLRVKLIDLHIRDSDDAGIRQELIRKHIEIITLKILRDIDGEIIITENYGELEELENFWNSSEGYIESFKALGGPPNYTAKV
jgi:hypothetical protein